MTKNASTEKAPKKRSKRARAEIFRLAAERCDLEHQWGGCIYIAAAYEAVHPDKAIDGKWQDNPEVSAFRRSFKPEEAGSLWWESDNEIADNAARVIGLCLMAAMVEAGDA